MRRRSFLGSLLGVVCLDVPFFAKLIVAPIQRVALPYHIGFIHEDGRIYQLPAVRDIRWSYDIENHSGKLNFIVEPLTCQQALILTHMALYREGELTRNRKRIMPLSSTVYMVPGDTLNATYTMSIHDVDAKRRGLSVEPTCGSAAIPIAEYFFAASKL